MKIKTYILFFLIVISPLFIQAKSTKYKLVVNVFNPIYQNDTVIFPNPQNFEELIKTYRCHDLLVTDATVLVSEFGSDKVIPLEFLKSENAYCCNISQESFTLTIQKKGFVDQKRIYLGNGHNDYIEYHGVINLIAFLFTKAETPIFIGKEILPYKASKNKIVLQIFDVEKDSVIDNVIEQFSKKYNLKNISNQYCKYPLQELRDDLKTEKQSSIPKYILNNKSTRPYYFIVLQKNKGEFSENDCIELTELRNYAWGRACGPLLGYYSLLQTKGNFNITYLTNYVKGSISLEDINTLNLKQVKTESSIYFCQANIGLSWAKQLYIFHLQNPTTEIFNLSTNLSDYK